MNQYNLTYNTHALISAPKIHTDLLWDLTFLFIGLGVVYFAAIFFFRNKMSTKATRIADKKKSLGPMISEFLFYEEDGSKEEKSSYVHLKIEIRELLKDKFNRVVLAEILLDLERDVSGDTHKQLCKLYYDLGLHLDAFKKLKSWRWELISKGILELTRMQVDESYTFITKFINDKRGVIRKQAEIATVTLKHEGINFFLDTTRYKISEWQQLKLLDVIRNLEEFDPPRFKAWLTSKNKYVVLFALRLIKYYNQNDANTSVTELIKHKNNQIKTEAIYCIREFCVFDAHPMLKKVYWKCNTDVKLLILDTLASIGSKEEIDFFKFVESKEANFIIKSKALSAINTIAPQTIMPTDGVASHIDEVRIPKITEEHPSENDTKEEYTNTLNEEIVEIPEIKAFDEAVLASSLQDQIEEIAEDYKTDSKKVPENEYIKLDFLPVVVEDVSEEVAEALRKKKDQKDAKIEMNLSEGKMDFVSLAFLPVVVEDVSEMVAKENKPKPTITDVETNVSKEKIDFVSLAFLPVVIEEETPQKNEISIHELEVITELVPYEVAQTTNNEEPKLEELSLLNIAVIFEEVSSLPILNLQDIEVIAEEVRVAESDPVLELEIDTTAVIPSTPLDIHNIDVISEILIPIPKEEEIPLIDFEESSDIAEIDISIEIPLVDETSYEDSFIEASLLENIHYHLQGSVFRRLYFDKDDSNKILLLDTIEDVGDKREIPLLKEIVVHENSTMLRERALEVLNMVSEIQYKIIDSNGTLMMENQLKGESIFKTLFETGDAESKLLLIDETISLGGWKEVSFLADLSFHESKKIRDKALAAKMMLETRLAKEAICKPTAPLDCQVTPAIYTIEKDIPLSKNEISETKDQIPLEFCFLLDELEIRTLEEEESGILDLEFGLEKDLKNSINEEFKSKEKTAVTIAKNSLFSSLLDLPLKIIDKLNG